MNEFSKRYDEFKKRHPRLHAVNGILSFIVLPALIFLAWGIFGIEEGRDILMAYAILGSMVFGAGMAIWVYFSYHKDFFLLIGVYPIAIGAAVTVVNGFLASAKLPWLTFDPVLLRYQLCCYISALGFAAIYATARDTMTDYICARTKLTEKQFDRRKDNFINYMWYRKIHKERGIGRLYYFNAIHTVLLAVFLIGTSLLLFWKALATPLMLLGLIAGLSSAVLGFFIFARAGKTKSRVYVKQKGKIPRNPYVSALGSIAMVLLFVWIQLQQFGDLQIMDLPIFDISIFDLPI